MLARDVVAFSNSGAPDFGYLGGLLHDIGKPVVAAMLLEAEKAILGAKSSVTWIGSAECRIVVDLAVALSEPAPELAASLQIGGLILSNGDRHGFPHAA